MYEIAFPFILGIFLAWITTFRSRKLPPKIEKKFLTVIIIVVAFGFILFPLEDGNVWGFVYEFLAMILILVGIILSRTISIYFLAIVWGVHGLWDAYYLINGLALEKPVWLVQLCVSYDLLIAAYIYFRIPKWKKQTNPVKKRTLYNHDL